jgi:hypothetical protein
VARTLSLPRRHSCRRLAAKLVRSRPPGRLAGSRIKLISLDEERPWRTRGPGDPPYTLMQIAKICEKYADWARVPAPRVPAVCNPVVPDFECSLATRSVLRFATGQARRTVQRQRGSKRERQRSRLPIPAPRYLVLDGIISHLLTVAYQYRNKLPAIHCQTASRRRRIYALVWSNPWWGVVSEFSPHHGQYCSQHFSQKNIEGGSICNSIGSWFSIW